MIVFLLALLATSASPPAAARSVEQEAPSVEQEIVVVAQKLARWRAKFVVRGPKLTCTTKRSTGDAEIDAIGCAAFEQCVGQLRSRIDESDRVDLPKATRRKMKVSIGRDLEACITARRDELIADLADRRFRRQSGGL